MSHFIELASRPCADFRHSAFHADAPPVDRDELARTRDAMTARGPDGAGLWISPNGRVGFDHRRLAIMDAMDQPSVDGFNTHVVSSVAHQEGFKVVLSGIGGDELFGSYPSFTDIPKWVMWTQLMRRFPGLRSLWPKIASKLRPQQPKLTGRRAHDTGIPVVEWMGKSARVDAAPGAALRKIALDVLAAFGADVSPD